MGDIAELLHTAENVPVQITTLSDKQTLGLAKQYANLNLSPTVLEELKLFRAVNKTTDKQSRWIIHAGFMTWRNAFGNAKGDSRTGLFLGLATVNYEDATPIYRFTDHDPQTIADTMLQTTNPMSGITLLNTTVCSHLATELQITGANAAFSPHADAGAAALVEAYFSLSEDKCERALCGAGSQKISPWYFWEYESLFGNRNDKTWFPCEAAAFIVAGQTRNGTDGQLLAVKRTSCPQGCVELHGLEDFIIDLHRRELSLPEQIIFSGTLDCSDELRGLSRKHFKEINQIFLDSIIGYAGPASTILSVNLALSMLAENAAIDQNKNGWRIFERSLDTVLVIALGMYGQVYYLLIGKN